jgi:hypothetical protein
MGGKLTHIKHFVKLKLVAVFNSSCCNANNPTIISEGDSDQVHWNSGGVDRPKIMLHDLVEKPTIDLPEVHSTKKTSKTNLDYG